MNFTIKGFFFLVLQALVNAEYKSLWVDVGSSESLSDTQIFNCCRLKKNIKYVTLGLMPHETLEREGLLCTICLRLEAMAYEILQQKTNRKGRQNCKLQDLQRQEGSGEGILGSRVRVLLGTTEQRPRVVIDRAKAKSGHRLLT